MSGDSRRISPTAHYTGHVWQRAGLSTPALATPRGRLFHASFRPLNRLSALLGGPSLDDMLVARHKAIDHLLTAAIDAGEVTQVLEIAAGYSPRGWRFRRAYGGRVRYVEADLPDVAEQKRHFLTGVAVPERPEVTAVDALASAGPLSLRAVTAGFDRSAGLAVITEGLLTYLPPGAARGLWSNIGALLSEFPRGIYLSDTRLSGQMQNSRAARIFKRWLQAFVRGSVHLHFRDEAEAGHTFAAAGFASFRLHRPAEMQELGIATTTGAGFVQIIEARTRRP